MSNLYLHHANVLADAAVVSGSEQDSLSSVAFLSDDRVSFKYTATGTHTLIQMDQPAGAIEPFRYLVLIDSTLSGGTAEVRTYPTAARSSATSVYSDNLTFAEPKVIDFGSVPSQLCYVDVELTTSGGQQLRIGEMMLASRFESPALPAPGIQTEYLPRRTFINLANGERQTIRHGGVCRRKVYSLRLLTAEQIAEWVDVFSDNEGARLVVLTDENADTYPALMSESLSVSDDELRFDVQLEFLEVKL